MTGSRPHVSVLVAAHDAGRYLRSALESADRALVLVHGEVVLQGDPRDLLDEPAVLEEAYLGAR